MRIIHGQGYTDADRAEFRPLVYRNVFIGIQVLVKAMQDLKLNYANPSNKVSLELHGYTVYVCVCVCACVCVVWSSLITIAIRQLVLLKRAISIRP